MTEPIMPATDLLVRSLKSAARDYNQSPGKTPLDNLVWGLSACVARIEADAATIKADRATIAELLAALEELRDRLEDHPAYAELTEDEEIETGGDTAEFSYLARVARAAILRARGGKPEEGA